MDAVDVIRTKRDGGALTDEQAAWFIDAYTRGEVADEHDRHLVEVVQGPGWVTFPGSLRPDELLERTRVAVPPDGPYETIGGFIMAELGSLPAVGDTVDVEGGSLRVERVDGRRVDRVRFTARPAATEEGHR